MKEFKPFTCPECGGKVRMLAPDGDRREYARGCSALIPPEILIPKCNRCGEVYLTVADGARIDAAMRQRRLDWQKSTVGAWLQGLQAAAGVTLREIETACHVTPTYLSHVANGTKLASAMLVTLLEMFVKHPNELIGRSTAGSLLSLSAPANAGEYGKAGALKTASVRWGHAEVVACANDVSRLDTRQQA